MRKRHFYVNFPRRLRCQRRTIFNLFFAKDDVIQFQHAYVNVTLTVESGEWNGTDGYLAMSDDLGGTLKFTSQHDTEVHVGWQAISEAEKARKTGLVGVILGPRVLVTNL